MVCFNPTHDDITKTEGLHFGQKKSVVDGVKGLDKIKADNMRMKNEECSSAYLNSFF